MLQHLNDGDFNTIRIPNCGKLDTNGTAADDHGRFRQCVAHDGIFIIHNFLSIQLNTGEDKGVRTCGDDNIFGFEGFRLTFFRCDFDGVFGG